MRIANPVYDCVFKFLMQDKASAKLIISAITEYEIEDIELRPTEVQISAGGMRDLTVYRLDMAAKIKTAEGSQLVTIEIQKARTATDIMRFRRYLGSQYSSEQNYEANNKVSEPPTPWPEKRALPIFTIYILGYALPTYPDIPVIKVKRSYYDNTTKKLLEQRDDFIESLTHDSAIIQIPALSGRRRDRLENILSIFDQALVTQQSMHTLAYSDYDQMPKEVQRLIKRLQAAFSTESVRQQMNLEDEILYELQRKQHQIMHLQDSLKSAQQLAETERQQKEEAERLANKLQAELDELKRKLKQ